MDTVKKVQNPFSVVLDLPLEKVHTHEVAQVFVHDLNQFRNRAITRGKTLAVPSLVKLCEGRGYSQSVGQTVKKARLTKQGKTISMQD